MPEQILRFYHALRRERECAAGDVGVMEFSHLFRCFCAMRLEQQSRSHCLVEPRGRESTLRPIPLPPPFREEGGG